MHHTVCMMITLQHTSHDIPCSANEIIAMGYTHCSAIQICCSFSLENKVKSLLDEQVLILFEQHVSCVSVSQLVLVSHSLLV